MSMVDGSRGWRPRQSTRSGSVDVVDLVAASEAMARSAPPAPDAAALLSGGADA